jgi:RNA polymerase sigma-70 factor (ECF subfamily)
MAATADTTVLFVQHRRALVDYATGIVGSRAQAEDLVQEAWLRFDEAVKKRFVSEPLSYLYRIVRNLALDNRRRVARENRVFTGDDPERAAAASMDRPSTPEAIALHRDQLDALMAALADLPERHRIAFEMHRIAGCTLREIAATLGVSVSQAQVLVVEGIEHCKQRMRRAN